LDSLKIKISIFILFIRFNHSTCNARPIRPHKIKGVAHYYKLRAVGGQIVLTNVFYRFNVSQCTCRRWITTIINLHTPPSGPPPKCPLMPILIINKKITLTTLRVLQKIINNKISFIRNKISRNKPKNHMTYLSQRSCII
jgi:hypothetical protein